MPGISGIVLGLICGLWYLPVLDFIGVASPHGASFLAYFLAFVAVVTQSLVPVIPEQSLEGSRQLVTLVRRQACDEAELTGLHQCVRSLEYATTFGCQFDRVCAPILSALHPSREALGFQRIDQSNHGSSVEAKRIRDRALRRATAGCHDGEDCVVACIQAKRSQVSVGHAAGGVGYAPQKVRNSSIEGARQRTAGVPRMYLAC